MSIDSSNYSLGSCLFITSGSINLTGKEKVFDRFQFKIWLKLSRIKIIIFYCVSRLIDLDIFQSLYCMKSIELYLKRKRGRETL